MCKDKMSILYDILNYVKDNPLEIPAIILSIWSLLLVYKRYKIVFARIILERIIATKGHTHVQLKIYPPNESERLSIIEIPTISKRQFSFYRKLNQIVDYHTEIDQTTNKQIPNVYYIHLSQFAELKKGTYRINVNIDKPPFKLKYKLKLPTVVVSHN